MNYKAYLRLIRPKHYLKNVLIFLPLVFGGKLFNARYFIHALFAFMAFSMIASAVYVINDLRDKELDAKHPTKRKRPIASGEVSPAAAIVLIAVLLVIGGVFQYFASTSLASIGFLGLYVLINIFYSFGLKNVPIIDVAILSIGFVLRVLYGGSSVGIEVSKWLYLAILAFSFYLGLGKRRNEIKTNGSETRKVNRHYNQNFLDKNMYVCLGLTITYYSLWAIAPEQKHKLVFWTIPLVIAIVMSYSLAIESEESDGDPVSVVLANAPLLALLAFYGIVMVGLVYI